MNPTTYRIFGWLADEFGTGYYRVKQPLDALAKRGHETSYALTMPIEAFETSAVFLGQRVIKDEPLQIWKELRRQGNSLLIYEVDDDLTTVHPTNARAYDAYMNPRAQANFREGLKAAHVVVVTTPALASLVKRWNKNVAIIPNFIRERWLDVPVQRREKAVVGWGGSNSHVHDFESQAEGLRAFWGRHPETVFHSIGCDYSAYTGAKIISGSPGEREIDAYYALLQHFDVGLAVVAPHLFNASKSHIKALEYAMLGIPVVASDYLTYRDFVQSGTTGFLARNPGEWVDALERLIKDPVLRADMGDAAREQAGEHTIEGNVHLYEQVIESNF